MSRMARSWRSPAVMLVMLSLLLVTSGQVMANHMSYPLGDYEYPWTNCSWNRSTRSSLRVVQSTAYPFPADSTAQDNGAPQSFRRRINDAVSRWSSNYTDASLPKTLEKRADGTSSEVLFQYRDPTTSGLLGQTYIQREVDSSPQARVCPLWGSGGYMIVRTTTRVQVRNDWFTQDDPYRAAWEACGSSFSGYTCSKRYDFGGVAAHELGHTLVLRHVEDALNGGLRGCGTATEPTMCQFVREHRTEFRTLEGYDRDALHKHVDVNG